MEKKTLYIAIAGETASGKSAMIFLLKKFLRESGFDVKFNGGIDFDSESEFDFHIKQNFDKKIESVKNNRLVEFSELQFNSTAKKK